MPAIPWLLAAGALAASGQVNFAIVVLVSVLACLIADSIWFFISVGSAGAKSLACFAAFRWSRDSCAVRRTQNLFSKHGWRGIVVAKFVPGLSTVVPPLAGMSTLNAGQFVVVDSVGSLLYCGAFLCMGFLLLSNQLLTNRQRDFWHRQQRFCLVLVGARMAYIGFKYWQRKRLLDELRIARISVDELRQMMETGKQIVILDLRSNIEFTAEPGIAGAIHLTMDDVKAGKFEIPKDREVVVYCSCPNEVTAARVALLLRRSGFSNVRPLLGGIDAWRGQVSAVSA